VRVSIIAFGNDFKERQELNGKVVDEINADLEIGPKLISSKRLRENSATAFEGTKKYGSFEVPGSVARGWLLAPTNVNGRPNSDVLRPWLNGRDFSARPSDRWIVDFSGLTETEANYYEAPYQHIQITVKPDRQKDRNLATRNRWWRFERERPHLRVLIGRLKRYIATTRHSKFRIFSWVHSSTVPDSALVVIACDDDVALGVLHSRFHETWALRLGSSLEDRPRYTPTTTFETFSFPEGLTPNISSKACAANPRAIVIAKAAKHLDELRNAWLNPSDLIDIVPEVVPGYPDRILPKTEAAAVELKKRTLTNLYNARPQWLVDAHRDLDTAVAAA